MPAEGTVIVKCLKRKKRGIDFTAIWPWAIKGDKYGNAKGTPKIRKFDVKARERE